ncbi:MAG TPA: HAD hydrolase family protein [Candidatus Binatia bacterium]|jgi:3-deoxy-D-manno-octulosonate 8-phosphate phosphatase (KDO 8-P phosphatase)|nr:HAD hydrolase family protein [Candidatus Binatia bacterium]
MPHKPSKGRKPGGAALKRRRSLKAHPSRTTHDAFLPTPASLSTRLSRIKLLLCDVDGVLTDGSVFIGRGAEFKQFNIQDGLGLVKLRRAGLKVGWISSRPSAATAQRAEELKIDFLRQDKGSKVATIEPLLARTGLKWDEVCYVGDDIVDLGPLKRAGVAVAVANAVGEAEAAADYVTKAAGGHGAVREVVELILKAQNKWKNIVAEHEA